MEPDAVNQLLQQFLQQTTDRMILVVVFMLALREGIDRLAALVRDRSASGASKQMLALMTTVVTQNQRLHEDAQRADERSDATINALNQTIEGLSKIVDAVEVAVKALIARTDYLVTQGNRIEAQATSMSELLKHGKTSTAALVEEKMTPLDERLKTVEAGLARLEQKTDRILALLEQRQAVPEAPAPAPAPGSDPAPPDAAPPVLVPQAQPEEEKTREDHAATP